MLDTTLLHTLSISGKLDNSSFSFGEFLSLTWAWITVLYHKPSTGLSMWPRLEPITLSMPLATEVGPRIDDMWFQQSQLYGMFGIDVQMQE